MGGADGYHCPRYVRFSNRPFGVKHFQTIHHSVDVTRGLLFGIGTKALPSSDSKTASDRLSQQSLIANQNV
jgi:hypothetical protein